MADENFKNEKPTIIAPEAEGQTREPEAAAPEQLQGLTFCASADFCERKLTTKERGEIVELELMTKAAKEKFRVLEPRGDSACYDAGLDNGKRIWKVQIRGVATLSLSDFYWVRTGMRENGKSRPYRKSDIDFLIAYVVPFNAWYVIPVHAIRRVKGIGLAPHRESQSKYEKYREAWHLMK